MLIALSRSLRSKASDADWRGLLIGMICVGAAPWLVGKKLRALSIWTAFTFIPPLCLIALAWDVIPAYFSWLSGVFAIFFFFLNLLMSWTPVPPQHWRVWVALPIFAICTGIFFRMACALFVENMVQGTNAMEPTLNQGDQILVDRTAYWRKGPQRGDLIAIRTSDSTIVKRIAGLPGERIRIAADGLMINGKSEQFPGNPKSLPSGSFLKNAEEELTVPAGEYFVLGDNPGNSLDSRSFGPISANSIAGKLTVRSFPADRISRVR